MKNRIRELSLGFLMEGAGEAGMIRMMRRIHDTVESYLSEAVPIDEKSKIACRRGCYHCCRVTVPLLLPEALLIASTLRSTMDRAELVSLMDRMRVFCRETCSYDEEERIAANINCVFLGGEGECTIHDVRPLACRAVISADAGACRAAMKMTLLDDYAWIPMNYTHKSATDSAFIGLAEAMDIVGINSRSFEITSQVLKILE